MQEAMSSSAGDTEISTDEVRVELCTNDGEGEEQQQHTYDGSRNGWDGNIGHSIDHHDDDDEDNLSLQVETDDVIQRMPSSVTGGESNTLGDEGSANATENVLIPQPRPLPTMKEKLVERERQRRVESERARWKRQFAMAAHAEAENDEDEREDANMDHVAATADHEHSFLNDRNSVAGTVGEDTVAPIDTLEEHNNDPNMNYPMERFLQDQQGGAEIEDPSSSNNNTNTEPQGVVMERFLQEQPTAPSNGFGASGVGSSPPSAVHETSESPMGGDLPLLNLPPTDGTADMMQSELPGEQLLGDNTFQSPSQEPRVVLRLTEAEIQEMAAIEDASRSNAPPSERDDMSELGELVSDFGLTHMMDNQNMSQGTPVTAQESVTSSVGNQIGQITVLSGSSSDHGVLDGLEGHSISSNVVASSTGGDVSLTGNPPSEVARDDDDDDHRREILSPRSSQVPTEILPTSTTVEVAPPSFARVPIADGSISNDDSADEIIVNRTMRPGLFNYKEHQRENADGGNLPKSRNRPIPTDVVNHHIEGFDFDKNDYPSSPQGDMVPSPSDMWSPGFSDRDMVQDYGATDDIPQDLERKRFGGRIDEANEPNGEAKPLLGGVPPAVNVTLKTTHQPHATESPRASLWSVIGDEDDLMYFAESVFSDVRSEGSATQLFLSNEFEKYTEIRPFWKAAISSRMVPLLVTLVVELPTLFFVSGGADRLCKLIGLTRFTTLVALLPIVSAMSGNVAVQATVLTRRAIQQRYLKWTNCNGWLVCEMSVACCLGIGMGMIIGAIAFVMGGFSFPFALAIFTAQFIGAFTAGCTGTLAPFLLALVFRRNAGRWSGLLETAVQDVIGSFAMIVITYHILVLFGPYEVGANDVCPTST